MDTIVGKIMDYENGTLGLDDTLDLFSHLIKTGHAWSLQGSYGRSAKNLIERGIISPDGVIDHARVEELLS